MALAAEFNNLVDDAEFRSATRRTLHLRVAAKSGSNLPSVVIHNLSMTGLQIETSEKLKIGEKFDIILPECGATEVGVVWATESFYGCEFVTPISPGAVSAALLSAPPRSSAVAEESQDNVYEFALEDIVHDKLPLRTRLLIIGGSAVTLWGVIGLGVWGLIR